MTPLTAAEILDDPARVADLDVSSATAILVQLSVAAAAVASMLNALPREAPATDTADRLLKAEEAAAILNVSTDFLYKSDAAKPLRVPMGGNVRFSYDAIQRYIARHRGR